MHGVKEARLEPSPSSLWGLIVGPVMSIFLLPTLYVWVAGDIDALPASEEEFTEEA